MARAKKSKGREAPNPSTVRKMIRSMAKKPWLSEVDIYLGPPRNRPSFELQTGLEMNRAKRIVFRNRRRPGFIIKFRLHDPRNFGYRFPSDPMDAVWSKAGTVCPKAAVRTIFWPFAVEDEGMTLVVYNKNPGPAIGYFKYSLRVTRDGGNSFELLDPGGNDQNGARS